MNTRNLYYNKSLYQCPAVGDPAVHEYVSELVQVAQRAGAESQPRRSRAKQEGEKGGRKKERRDNPVGKESRPEEVEKKREKAGPRVDRRGGPVSSSYSPARIMHRVTLLRRSTSPLALDRPLVRAPRVRSSSSGWAVRSVCGWCAATVITFHHVPLPRGWGPAEFFSLYLRFCVEMV